MSISLTTITTDQEIHEVLVLQTQNLSSVVSEDRARTDGFVTVKHSFELLKKMNDTIPQVIAKSGNSVVGYALVMPESFSELIPVLTPMFDTLRTLSYANKKIEAYSFYAMGQICISENFRRQGIFDKLYQKHRELYQSQFDLCITEVSDRNPRSMRAHERVGFETIHTFKDATDIWNILVWTWR